MNEEQRFHLKLLSILLQYPDDEIVDSLGELKEAAQEISQVEKRRIYLKFLQYLGSNLLIRLQEEYTTSFDFKPATSLNLTYHKWGDARERGNALLEFLSINHQECDFSFLGDYLGQLRGIGARLEECASPYAGLLETALDIFRELKLNGA
jgi:nitrate reductase assembly molybdenum cofactor insertion protein NarJ